MSYWQIRLNTSVSGVSLYNAEVTYADRTTDGDCSGFDTYLGDVSGPDNTITQVYNPKAQTISMPIQITAHMACATSDRTGNIVAMNSTVLVDYDDGSARRRRGVTRVGVREARELYVQEETGVRYTAADLQLDQTPRHSTDKEERDGGSHGNATRVIAACAVVLVLCLCCCAGLCALVIRRRRKRYWDARKQRDFITSYSQGSGMNLGQQSSSSKLGGKFSVTLKTNAKV
ncbi:hypothetical protein SARC_08060 [Sphaeroforma arctica JP610]|uniref:Uncharacterized protein n=1 Tax=Sphaeroforma arctica JP610 TaxID=667725 RepID=A0A0L0FS61_9EUKA|nr:hypothetical protein SARC_08060 [Sphaeroforma arctica JP610]KNC79549.1 hypothetical protein SARC_08060 [Sphaeroforma arctica JP610]|eukprot:XP_014153451.1 hypothetical protein SARC_08060 [Sphaeroforma arctica JP610]